MKKKQNFVDFPVDNLDLSKHVCYTNRWVLVLLVRVYMKWVLDDGDVHKNFKYPGSAKWCQQWYNVTKAWGVTAPHYNNNYYYYYCIIILPLSPPLSGVCLSQTGTPSMTCMLCPTTMEPWTGVTTQLSVSLQTNRCGTSLMTTRCMNTQASRLMLHTFCSTRQAVSTLLLPVLAEALSPVKSRNNFVHKIYIVDSGGSDDNTSIIVRSCNIFYT